LLMASPRPLLSFFRNEFAWLIIPSMTGVCAWGGKVWWCRWCGGVVVRKRAGAHGPGALVPAARQRAAG
jgi:hypothetical protein